MVDNDIAGCNWIELPQGKYSIRKDHEKDSLCQIEGDIVYTNIISHPPQGVWGRLAPFRIFSFDIECMGRAGHFPEPDKVTEEYRSILVVYLTIHSLTSHFWILSGSCHSNCKCSYGTRM